MMIIPITKLKKPATYLNILCIVLTLEINAIGNPIMLLTMDIPIMEPIPKTRIKPSINAGFSIVVAVRTMRLPLPARP